MRYGVGKRKSFESQGVFSSGGLTCRVRAVWERGNPGLQRALPDAAVKRLDFVRSQASLPAEAGVMERPRRGFRKNTGDQARQRE